MYRCFALSLVAVMVGTAAAQAPQITPAGDPSVKSDTIYRLAVNPADHPDDEYVYLLDDGVIRVEADGRGSRTYRQIVQVLTREAAERWGEQSFDYVSGREKLTINWIRVLKPDGTVIADKPTHEQESIAPVAQQAPVFSDVKVHRVSIGGIAPGTLLDYSYTIETLQPVMPGDYQNSWRVTTGELTRRSRYVVDVPATLTPRIKETHLFFPRRTVEAHGRRVYTWAVADVPKVELEPFAGDSEGLGTFITVSTPITWAQVASWYATLSRDRYAVTPVLDSALTRIVSGARTLDDSLRALHRWVAQDFRYVSLSLGIGGFRPRFPAEVYDAKYGDCKDKATLFIALARRMGVKAYPVLLSSTGGVERDLPSAHAFDHMIAAVERPNGYQYLDLTADLTPYGTLPPGEHGEFGLIVHPDGRGEEISFPADSAISNREETVIEGDLNPDGVFSGRFTTHQTGDRQYELRGALTSSLNSTERERLARQIANNVIPGANGDSVQLFDGRDWTADPRISVAIHDGRVASKSGAGSDILTLPLRDFAVPGLVNDLTTRGPRKYAINAAAVSGGLHVESSELRLTLPEGWRAQLPPSITATGPFGSYSAEYSQQGRVLRVVRRLTGVKGIEPRAKIGDLIAWLKEMSQDDVKYIVLEHGGATK